MGDGVDRTCPVQDRVGGVRSIPWGLAQILYPAYGHAQTLERIAERGGFGVEELGLLAVDRYAGRPRLKRMPLLDLWESRAYPADVARVRERVVEAARRISGVRSGAWPELAAALADLDAAEGGAG